MKKFIKGAVCAGVVWLVFALILFPKNCIDAGLWGVFLCLDTVIPSLFPFFVCSGLIIRLNLYKPLQKVFSAFMRPLFGVSGSCAVPFVLGLLSGYPVGARCVVDLYSSGEVSKKEAEKLLAFCNNSGPLFILGAVGAGMMENASVGRYLYIIHILSAFATGMLFKLVKTEETELMPLKKEKKEGFIKSVLSAFSGATESIVSVCGFVVLFSVLGAAIPHFFASPVLCGLLEITNGTEKILNMPIDFNLKISVLSGIIAFSGGSVMLQVCGIISKTNLSPRLYFLGKAVQGGVAYALSMLATRLFPIAQMTAGFDGGETKILKTSLLLAAMILIFLAAFKKNSVDN